MYKLLIADDEEETRTGLRTIIDWEAHGIEVCAEAENGKEALELIGRTSPDILLVDIRMPIMDGLQVIEALQKAGSSTKAVILSGYDDFTYAQKALKLGTMDYLLKPCRPKEILETVLKVKARIEEEREKSDRTERIRQQFQEILPVLKEKYLTRLLQGVIPDESRIGEDIELYQIALAPSAASAAVLRIDNFAAVREQKSNADAEMMKLAVADSARRILDSRIRCEVFGYSDDVIVVADFETERDCAPLPILLAALKTEIYGHHGFTVSIGVGGPCASLSRIRQSYEEALKTLEFLFFTGANSILAYEEIREYAFSQSKYPLAEEREIVNSILSGRADGLPGKLGDFFHALNAGQMPKEHCIHSALALLFSVYHACIENGVDNEEVFGSALSAVDAIANTDKLSALETGLLKILDTSARKFASIKSKNSYVELILKYIEDNYAKDISLDSIASEAYITPGYASQLFKQTIGINFIDYLQKVRIKKACELIKDMRIKIYEVSSRVGFKDEKYFSQVFKKSTGMTPSQYREFVVHSDLH